SLSVSDVSSPKKLQDSSEFRSLRADIEKRLGKPNDEEERSVSWNVRVFWTLTIEKELLRTGDGSMRDGLSSPLGPRSLPCKTPPYRSFGCFTLCLLRYAFVTFNSYP